MRLNEKSVKPEKNFKIFERLLGYATVFDVMVGQQLLPNGPVRTDILFTSNLFANSYIICE